MEITFTTPDEYVAQLPNDKREIIQKIRTKLLENLPEGFREEIGYGMIGYVVPHSLYPAGYQSNPKLPLPFINLASQKNYILVGPGRWGSSDSWLGIPVKWPHISAARVIVEVALKNYRVDPSQGTHFFQNLTSFGVGYFTIDTNTNDGLFRKDILDSMPAMNQADFDVAGTTITICLEGKNRCK